MNPISILINQESCTKCTKCVKVCPSKIFSFSKEEKKVNTSNEESCIKCGHCVCACESSSITHSIFPQKSIHSIDYTKLPTPEQMLLLTKVRRSNRAFTKEEISSQALNMILEAAHRAPTASNSQTVQFTVITSPEKLKIVSEFTLDTFIGIAKKLENPLLKPILKRLMAPIYRYVPIFHRLVEQYKLGNDMILRGATALIFIHTPKNSKFGCQDANLAYQNGSLMAETLGISQFYTGFVCSALQQGDADKLYKELGINGKVHAGLALGMPQFRFQNYVDRDEIVVDKL